MGHILYFFYFRALWVFFPLLGFQSFALGQADEIQLSGVHRSSLQISINKGRNIRFRVATFDNYQKGLKNPLVYTSIFKVQSNVDYKVYISSTDFSDRNGNILTSENIGVKVKHISNNRPRKNHKQRETLKIPTHIVLLGDDSELVSSQGKGNHGRGRTDLNRFQLQFEIGTPAVRRKSGLSSLLSQHITPGAYASRITLTAVPKP